MTTADQDHLYRRAAAISTSSTSASTPALAAVRAAAGREHPVLIAGRP